MCATDRVYLFKMLFKPKHGADARHLVQVVITTVPSKISLAPTTAALLELVDTAGARSRPSLRTLATPTATRPGGRDVSGTGTKSHGSCSSQAPGDRHRLQVCSGRARVQTQLHQIPPATQFLIVLKSSGYTIA